MAAQLAAISLRQKQALSGCALLLRRLQQHPARSGGNTGR